MYNVLQVDFIGCETLDTQGIQDPMFHKRILFTLFIQYARFYARLTEKACFLGEKSQKCLLLDKALKMCIEKPERY